LPDGNVYQDVLRIKVEKNYTQTFQNGSKDEEFQVKSVRYQYFAKGVRYPILIILESDVTTSCNCACNSRTREAYYQTPAFQFGDTGKDIISDKGETLIENFEYNVAPNPFENELNVAFSLKKDAKVEINLVDMNGRIVKKVINEKLQKGDYIYNANTADVIAGSYVLQLKVDKDTYTNKLIKK
jgi:hypothetical protein